MGTRLMIILSLLCLFFSIRRLFFCLNDARLPASTVALNIDPVVLRVTLKRFVWPVAAFMTSRCMTDFISRFSSRFFHN